MDSRRTVPVTKDDAYEVSDPTDWLNTPLSSLAAVEQSLRCHVCKDFYDSPMITSCSHTFCSLCIRRALAADSKCPECRAQDQESKLRRNGAILGSVEAFKRSRESILEFAKRPAVAAEPAVTSKRKASTEETHAESSSKRTRMSTRLRRSKGAEATAVMMRDEVDLTEEPDDAMDDYKPVLDDGLVECPICLTRMKAEKVDRHLDTSCPGPGQSQPQKPMSAPKSNKLNLVSAQSLYSDSAAKKPEMLPSLSYSLLKENQLKKKLAELNISTQGPRLMLERRHKEWVTIWNANCDSVRPKKKSDLLRDLDTWERTVGSRAPLLSHSANLGAQIKDKDFDSDAWAAQHTDSFNDLIANALKSRKKAADQAKEASSSSKDDTRPAEQAPNGVAAENVGLGGGIGTESLPPPESPAVNGHVDVGNLPEEDPVRADMTFPSSSQVEPESPARENPEPLDPQRLRSLPTNQPVVELDSTVRSGTETTPL